MKLSGAHVLRADRSLTGIRRLSLLLLLVATCVPHHCSALRLVLNAENASDADSEAADVESKVDSEVDGDEAANASNGEAANETKAESEAANVENKVESEAVDVENKVESEAKSYEPDIVVDDTRKRPFRAGEEEILRRGLSHYETSIESFISVVVWFMLVSLVACFYHRQRLHPRDEHAPIGSPEELDEYRDFKFGLFSCFSQPDICLWSCCCPAIRWAETMSLAGVLSFWLAFFIFLSLSALANTTGEMLLWATLAAVGAGFRQELRAKFDMKRIGGVTFFEDFCLFCCCTCCVIAQEAAHVDDACRVGHPYLPGPGAGPAPVSGTNAASYPEARPL